MDKTYRELAIENFKLSDDMCRGYKDYLLAELEKLEKIEQIIEQYQFYKFDGFLKIKEVLEQE